MSESPKAPDESNPFGPDGVIIYDIRMKPDKTLDITLSHVHRQLLCLIAARGGETDYDFRLLMKDEDPFWVAQDEKRFGETIDLHVKRLIKPMRLLESIPILGEHPEKVRLRLTDFGRNIVTKILENQGIVLP